jgi:hypothetical protein
MRIRMTILGLLLLPGLSFAQRWQPVGGGTSSFVEALYADTTNHILYVGGCFKYAGDSLVRHIAAWDGNTWHKLGDGTGSEENGPASSIISIVEWNGSIFAGGVNEMMAGNWGWRYLNRWDGQQWENCGNPDGPAFVEIANGELLGVGKFTEIYGQAVRKISRWDGNNFISFVSPLPIGNPDDVFCATYYNEKYYFGGNLDLPGINEIVSWDGNQWESPGLGILGDSWVNRMREYKGLLFVGGEFWESTGNTSNDITVWDGNNWQDPFPDVQFYAQVTDLQVIDGNLYVAGMHAVFDGTSWHGPYMLAKYDGIEFCSFGGEGIHQATRIAGLDGHLYFNTDLVLHGDTANYLVEWLGGEGDMDVCISQPTPVREVAQIDTDVVMFPNPTSDRFVLTLPSQAINVSLCIHDLAGRLVLPGWKYKGEEVDVSMLPSGVYFVEVWWKDFKEVIKLVKAY